MSGRAVRRHRRPGQARDDAPDGDGPGRSYEELYVEYAPVARGLALSMVPPDVADDIVAEAFARVLAAIRAGGGPDHAFRRTCSPPCATSRTTG
jgi:DNA-directed RNA polymerase specialized sigma24 family protein